MPAARPVIDRIMDKISIQAGGCWEWTGSTNNKGYAWVHFKGKTSLAHRLMYESRNGPIEGGLFCCHHCDNPKCVNPDHLFLGTNGDNMRDCAAKGRTRPSGVSGESHPMRKLTSSQVVEIRAKYSAGLGTKAVLATEYRISQTTCGRIISGRIWRDRAHHPNQA
jgi:hypothetical protein